jgi:release factor glutamine methyltransferase
LTKHNIDDSYFESRALLCHVLGISPALLYSDFEHILSTQEYRLLISLVDRRLNHEPLAYLTGQKEFYGIDMLVNNDVLIPRPETELLVEQALEIIRHDVKYLNGEQVTIADIGTGSGAISIGIASNIDKVRIYAIDISEKALDVARLNIDKHCLQDSIIPLRSNLLESLPEPVDLIVANLPYIRESDINNLIPEIKAFEPEIALNGGEDGLYKIRGLLCKVQHYLKNGGYILLEIGQGQNDSLENFISEHFINAKYKISDDFNGIPRILSISLS